MARLFVVRLDARGRLFGDRGRALQCGARAVKLAHLDLNKDKENQNLLCYRYTMGQLVCESQTRVRIVPVTLLGGRRADAGVDQTVVDRRAVFHTRSPKAAGTQGGSVPPCVDGGHRAGSTGDGHARRGVGRPSKGPCPRLPQGWSVLWPRQDTPCGAAVAGEGSRIIRHRRPIKEGRKSYRFALPLQGVLAWGGAGFRCEDAHATGAKPS